MVDIHTHILPRVDDGPSGTEETINLARQAVEEGIAAMIATPHHRHPRFDTTGFDVSQAVDQLNALLLKQGIPLEVHAGQEVRIYGELQGELGNGQTMSLAGSRYVLVELPSSSVPSYTRPLFTSLLMDGYVPIIAHPERNKAIRESPRVLLELVAGGVLSQVTCASVAGRHGKEIQRFSIALLAKGLAHLVASDAHDLTRRPFYWKVCREILARQLNNSLFEEIYENSQSVLRDTPIISARPEMINRNWRGRFL